jgi:hypothetical protein
VSPRDTSTGSVLEQMVIPALDHGGYRCRTQVGVGVRPGGGAHKADVLAERDGRAWIISLKWQQVSGTAEQKVPFEVICLAEAVRSGPYERAYLVLGGRGWSLREFYIGDGLRRYLAGTDNVSIVSLEEFIARANRGNL